MSLNVSGTKGYKLLVNDDHHAEPRAAYPGRDAGVPGRQSKHWLQSPGTRADLSLCRAYLGGAALPTAWQEAEGHRAAVSGAAERVESGPVDAADGAVASAPTDRGPTTPSAPLSAPLHTPGHCLVSNRRRCPRGSVRAGGTAHPRARVSVLRQLGVRPPGPHLDFPHLQPAALPGLSLTAGGVRSHSETTGRDRRAAQARATGTTRLSARRYGSTRVTGTLARGCITSTPSIRSRSGRSSAASRRSRSDT